MKIKLDNIDESPCHTTWHPVDNEQMLSDTLVSTVLVARDNWNSQVRLPIVLIKVFVVSIRNLLWLT